MRNCHLYIGFSLVAEKGVENDGNEVDEERRPHVYCVCQRHLWGYKVKVHGFIQSWGTRMVSSVFLVVQLNWECYKLAIWQARTSTVNQCVWLIFCELEFCQLHLYWSPVLTVKKLAGEPGRWHNGSAFVFCSCGCTFESEPSPTSAHAYGEVTGCACSKCSTRGESWGMYITFASAKIANKAEPTLALKPRGDVTRNPKQGYQWPQKRTCVRQKLKKKKKKKLAGVTLEMNLGESIYT